MATIERDFPGSSTREKRAKEKNASCGSQAGRVRCFRTGAFAQRFGDARLHHLGKLSDLLALSPYGHNDCYTSPAFSRRAAQAAGAQHRSATVGLLLLGASPVRDPARLRAATG